MTRNVIAVVDDLFFASRIRGAAEPAGVRVSFPRKLQDLIDAAVRNQPELIIVDLQAQRINSLELAKQLKSDERLRQIPLVGFFPHVQTELQQQALDAGFDRVLPRSAFVNRLAEMLAGGG